MISSFEIREAPQKVKALLLPTSSLIAWPLPPLPLNGLAISVETFFCGFPFL